MALFMPSFNIQQRQPPGRRLTERLALQTDVGPDGIRQPCAPHNDSLTQTRLPVPSRRPWATHRSCQRLHCRRSCARRGGACALLRRAEPLGCPGHCLSHGHPGHGPHAGLGCHPRRPAPRPAQRRWVLQELGAFSCGGCCAGCMLAFAQFLCEPAGAHERSFAPQRQGCSLWIVQPSSKAGHPRQQMLGTAVNTTCWGSSLPAGFLRQLARYGKSLGCAASATAIASPSAPAAIGQFGVAVPEPQLLTQ